MKTAVAKVKTELRLATVSLCFSGKDREKDFFFPKSVKLPDVLHALLHFLAETPRLIFLKAIVPSELICILNTNVYQTKNIKRRNLIKLGVHGTYCTPNALCTSTPSNLTRALGGMGDAGVLFHSSNDGAEGQRGWQPTSAHWLRNGALAGLPGCSILVFLLLHLGI